MILGAVVSHQFQVKSIVGQACRTSATPLNGASVPGFPVGMYGVEAAVPAMSTDQENKWTTIHHSWKDYLLIHLCLNYYVPGLKQRETIQLRRQSGHYGLRS